MTRCHFITFTGIIQDVGEKSGRVADLPSYSKSLVFIRKHDIIIKCPFSRCSAVGSVRALGAWGRRFEPCHLDQKTGRKNRSSKISFCRFFFYLVGLP